MSPLRSMLRKLIDEYGDQWSGKDLFEAESLIEERFILEVEVDAVELLENNGLKASHANYIELISELYKPKTYQCLVELVESDSVKHQDRVGLTLDSIVQDLQVKGRL